MHLLIHVFSWLDSSFPFNSEKYSIVWMYQFIHALNKGYLGCFQVLTVMNKTAIYIHMQVFFFNFIYLFICLFIYGCVWSSFLFEGLL